MSSHGRLRNSIAVTMRMGRCGGRQAELTARMIEPEKLDGHKEVIDGVSQHPRSKWQRCWQEKKQVSLACRLFDLKRLIMDPAKSASVSGQSGQAVKLLAEVAMSNGMPNCPSGFQAMMSSRIGKGAEAEA